MWSLRFSGMFRGVGLYSGTDVSVQCFALEEVKDTFSTNFDDQLPNLCSVTSQRIKGLTLQRKPKISHGTVPYMRYSLRCKIKKNLTNYRRGDRTMALASTKPLTGMSTRNISWGVKAPVPIVLKSGSVRACRGQHRDLIYLCRREERAMYIWVTPLKNTIPVYKLSLAGTLCFQYGLILFSVTFFLVVAPSREGGRGWSIWQCGSHSDHCNLCEQVNGKTSVWRAVLLICGCVDAESVPFDLQPQNCQRGSHVHIAAALYWSRRQNDSNCVQLEHPTYPQCYLNAGGGSNGWRFYASVFN
jgi:hypothetical protein